MTEIWGFCQTEGFITEQSRVTAISRLKLGTDSGKELNNS